MTQRGRKPSLTKLQEKHAKLAAQIRAAKRAERQHELKLERQRYAIIGQALAKELAENSDLAAELEPVINRRVTKAKDRAFLDLPPLQKKTPSAGQ